MMDTDISEGPAATIFKANPKDCGTIFLKEEHNPEDRNLKTLKLTWTVTIHVSHQFKKKCQDGVLAPPWLDFSPD
jgi:hypothetical protein